jgi:hypothetical protein
MAKKAKKVNLPKEALERARAELAMQESVTFEETPKRTKSVSSKKKDAPPVQRVTSFKRSMTREELQEEYGYVLADLQSMAVLALILFVAMVVVALSIESFV